MTTRLPTVRIQEVLRMQEFLQAKYGSRRPPKVAAALLVLYVHMDSIGEPLLATRAQVARHLRVNSLYGIDAAIKLAKERELIEEKVVRFPIGARLRLSQHVVARRYFVPSDEVRRVIR